ncbi:MAG: hypothetical protein KatS3mg102_0162 [Planctomycetota bacterium]|nr:MAG: hypothetical protein KatS3mg102_0162 [Planctomycetota bacterium]
MGIAVTVGAVLAAALCYVAMRAAARRAQALELAVGRARAEAARLAARSRRLAREIELLSAARDLALIANADGDFARIAEESLRVVAELTGAPALALFTVEESREGARVLRLRARRGLEACRAAAAGCAPAIQALAEEALTARRRRSCTSAEAVAVALPLFADAEPIGVLWVERPVAPAEPGGPPPADPLATGRSPGGEELVGETVAVLEALARHVAAAIRKPALYDRAVHDPLTGLFTRRHLVRELERACARSLRTGAPLAVVLLDIDHFKRVNDTWGHLAGDAVLAGVAGVVRASVRAYDLVFRYGGEELAILAAEASGAVARALAERVRRAIEAAQFADPEGRELRVTASLGVAAFARGRQTPQALLAAADQALYRAKERGRNRVVLAPSRVRPPSGSRARPGEGTAQPRPAGSPPCP